MVTVSNGRVVIELAKTTMGMDQSMMRGGKLSVDRGLWNEGVVTKDWLSDCEPAELPWEGKANHRETDAVRPEPLMEDDLMHLPVLH